MRRSELEHIIRASGDVAGDGQIIIIGSQSILGQFPQAPLSLLVSMEADVYPAHKPEMADKVDGAIGEGSRFHVLNGYYAQGVGPGTAVLPKGWKDRLVTIKNENTSGITGLCLDVHDLAVSKLIAGRHKDLEFIQELVRYKMIRESTLQIRLADTELQTAERGRIKIKISAMFAHGS